MTFQTHPNTVVLFTIGGTGQHRSSQLLLPQNITSLNSGGF